MPNPWFKFFGGEYLSDLKVRNFTAIEHSCWLHLLCFASNSSTPGVIHHLTEKNLLVYAGVSDESDARDILSTFERDGMIKRDGEKIFILHWKQRQKMSATGAERQAKYRRKRKRTGDGKVTTVSENSDARIEEDKNRIEEDRYTPIPHLAPAAEILGSKEYELKRKFPDQKRQLRGIGQMLAAGYSPEQIEECWKFMEKDSFWSEKGFDFANLVNQIGKEKGKKQEGFVSFAKSNKK